MSSQTAIATVYLFMLAAFLGYQVISRVPSLLHTPLMSATNAISGISLVGSLVAAGAQHTTFSTILGFLAVTCATTNVVGGFIITDRMLRMFKKKPAATSEEKKVLTSRMRNYLIEASYFLASILFILGLRGLSHPETARRGMHLAEFGMLMAIIGTLMHQEIVSYEWIIAGLLLGSAIGTGIGLWVPMTAMPQRTAFSHAFGAFAAALVGVSEYSLHGASLSKFTMGALGFDVLLGSLTTTGSLVAFAKLQGMLPGRPMTYKGQNIFNLSLLGVIILAFVILIFHPGSDAALLPDGGPLAGVWRLAGASDRLRRHAGSHRAAQCLCRLGFRGDWLCHFQQCSDHRRHAGRGLGIYSLDRHVQGDEPLDYRRPLRRFRKSVRGHDECYRGDHAGGQYRGPRAAARVCAPGGLRARLRNGYRPGATRRSANFPLPWKMRA